MDTLHDRLAELADDAPTGGAPAAELWARGKRAHRLRAAGLAATLLVIVAVGTGIGVRLADGDGDHSVPEPVAPRSSGLPIEYPVGEELPDLGDSPGPLAAIWVVPGGGGDAAKAVGLVSETGAFGTLPIDVAMVGDDLDPRPGLALSPDGRKIAYQPREAEVLVHDLVSGRTDSPGIDTRPGFTWAEDTLVGFVAGGSDVDGWVWEPGGTAERVDLKTYGESTADLLGRWSTLAPGTRDIWVASQGGGPRSCSPPTLENWGGRSEEPQLCDVLAIFGTGTVLGHANDPSHDNSTVVALDHPDLDSPFVVVAADAPEWVSFATDLIGEALDAEGGAS